MTGSEGKVVLVVDAPSYDGDSGIDPSVCDILISTAFRLSGNDVGRLHSLMVCTMAKYIHDISDPEIHYGVDSVLSDIRRSHREYSELMCGDVPDTGEILGAVSECDRADEGEIILEPFNIYERESEEEVFPHPMPDLRTEFDQIPEGTSGNGDDEIIALCVLDPDDGSVVRILAHIDGDPIDIPDGCGCRGCGSNRCVGPCSNGCCRSEEGSDVW